MTVTVDTPQTNTTAYQVTMAENSQQMSQTRHQYNVRANHFVYCSCNAACYYVKWFALLLTATVTSVTSRTVTFRAFKDGVHIY